MIPADVADRLAPVAPVVPLTDTRRPWTLLTAGVEVARLGSPNRLTGDDSALRQGWTEHVAGLGSRPNGGEWLIEALEESRLTGYGGGHFPVARKWRSALAAGGEVTVVANASESEPLSAKDATLLRQRPHLLLDGLSCAMETLGAVRGVVWLHASDVFTRRVVHEAIEERRLAGERLEISVVGAPDTYLAGESSAIARALAGGPALPTYRGARRSSRSSGGPNTVVHNVETLARVALTARECSFSPSRPRLECFVDVPATSLLTVLTPGAREVIEVPRDLTLRQAIGQTAWSGFGDPDAVLLGGYGGQWARWDEVRDREVNEVAMREVGLTLGAGIVAPLRAGVCGVAETARIADYLAASSARQCGPCMFGLPAVAEVLHHLVAGSAPRRVLRRMMADMAAVRNRGACHHPDGAIRLVASALDVFADDFAAHARRRPCGNSDASWIPVPEVA